MGYSEIHQKLKQLRKERGLTLNNLAQKIGSDYQQISRIERGKSKLTIDLLVKMAQALETPISKIVEPLPVESKTNPGSNLESSTSSPSLSQSILTLILEKIEFLWHTTHFKIHPQTKATLISQIYKQALSLFQKNNDASSIQELIQFSIEIIKTTLADFDNEIVKTYQKEGESISEDVENL